MVGMAPKGPPAEELDDEEPNASPEEQAAYEDFVLAGLALIYEDKQVRPGILKMLDEDPQDLMQILSSAEELQEFSPVVAVAATAVVIVLEIMRHAGDERPSDELVLHGGAAIVEELVEIQGRIGKELSQDDLHRAMSMAMDLYREAGTQAGFVDEGKLKAQFEELVAADKEGRLGEVSPELDQINKLAEKNMVEGEEPEEGAVQ